MSPSTPSLVNGALVSMYLVDPPHLGTLAFATNCVTQRVDAAVSLLLDKTAVGIVTVPMNVGLDCGAKFAAMLATHLVVGIRKLISPRAGSLSSTGMPVKVGLLIGADPVTSE